MITCVRVWRATRSVPPVLAVRKGSLVQALDGGIQLELIARRARREATTRDDGRRRLAPRQGSAGDDGRRVADRRA